MTLIKIKTEIIRKEEKIVVTEEWEGFPSCYKYIVSLKEKSIRAALIELGWRPPVEDYIKDGKIVNNDDPYISKIYGGRL